MSLPLKRRMARVALLVAAAAPVIGIGATTASAAGLPQTADLGGLSQTDAGSHLGSNVNDAAHKAVGVANEAGGNAAGTLVPATGQTLDATGRTLTPTARKAAGQTAGAAHGGQGLTGALPTQGLQSGGLPVDGLSSL